MADQNLVIYYVLAMGIGGLLVSGFFLFLLNRNRAWDYREIAFKFTAALTFFSTATLTEVLENTWNLLSVMGYTFPSMQVIFDALVLGFMISGLWDFWTLNRD